MNLRIRAQHRSRPLMEPLESLAPVSTLVAGISPSPALAAVEAIRVDEDQSGHLAPANGIASDAPIGQLIVPNLHVSDGLGISAAADDTAKSAPGILAAAPASASGTPAASGGVVVDEVTSVASTPASGAAPVPSVNSRPSVISPGVKPSGGIVLNVTANHSAATGQIPPPSDPLAQSTPNAAAGVIRSMTLAPTAQSAKTDAPATAGAMSASIIEAVSGGAFGPPTIIGGSGTSLAGSAPNYTLNTPQGELPIGAVPTFMVSGGGFASIQWSGGTTVNNYLGSAADQAPPQQQGPPTSPVPTNQSSYSFIVQAEAPGSEGFSYTVSASVTYTDDPSKTNYTSYVRFSSDPPSVASLSVDHIAPNVLAYVASDGFDYLELAMKPSPQVPADAGIRLTANTETHLFAGQFMFLQVLSPGNATYYRQISNGVTAWRPNAPQPNPGFNQDPGATLGYENEAGAFYWEITTANTAAATQAMNDSPNVVGDSTQYNRLAAGFAGGGTPKTYTTYLMFKPNNYPGQAVWVALQKVTWSWGMAAILTPGQNPTVISTDTPKATPASAVGVWPTWSALVTQQTLQVYTGVNPWPS